MASRFLLLILFSSLCRNAIAQTEIDSLLLKSEAPIYTDEKEVISKNPENWLNSVGENYLDKKELCSNCETFRFVWERTFKSPVIVRFDKRNNGYSITYKIGKGASGYAPWGLKKKRTIIYSQKEWDYLKSILSIQKLSDLPNNRYMIMTDGTNWIIEYRSDKIYKAHYTNIPGEELVEFSFYLLELTGESFDGITSASDYAQNKIYLSSNNEIIRRKEITIALIKHMNTFFKQNKIEDEFCYYPDYIITIKRNGRISKVKSAYEGTNFFENLSYFFEDRKCRGVYKKALGNLNLSSLDLKKSISFYFTNATWDKERNKLIYDKE